MLCLSNRRHERFAQLVAKGDSGGAAYRVVCGAKAASAHAAASRLLRIAKVSARIAEIQKAAVCASVMTLLEKRQFLALIVRTPIGQIDENSPLCQWFRRTTGRRATFSIRMPDKLQAILLDARLAGELKGNSITVQATAPANGYVMTAERLAELREKKRAAIERGLARQNGMS